MHDAVRQRLVALTTTLGPAPLDAVAGTAVAGTAVVDADDLSRS
ncbi:hypothetical protein ACFYZ2_13280 [Streptomyces sviceus]